MPEQKTEQKTEQKNVRLFTLTTCSHCKEVKELLFQNRIPYNSTDVDLVAKEERKAIYEEMDLYNPDRTFPTIVIDDTVIIGKKEDEILKALGLS
jgi:glutaredoxin-like protein NrdH